MKNKYVKRYLGLVMAAALAMTGLAGCGGATSSKTGGRSADKAELSGDASGNGGDKISVVTTIFPEYDWVKEITGGAENIDLTMLLDDGVDLHSFQPTADDIIKISNCDLFVYVGGESDGWVEDVLKNAKNKNMKVVNLLDTLGDSVREEEVVEGMQAEDEHDHDHEDEDKDHHEGEEKDHQEDDKEAEDKDSQDLEEKDGHHQEEEEEPEYDEHVWLSLKNAKILTSRIAESLEQIDPAHADSYKTNLADYQKKLADLDSKYAEAAKAGSKDTLLFGDRFPFRYMVEDYNLNYYAAFVGCSAETEASFETIKFLAGKVDELQLPAILTIEGKDHKIASTIQENTKDKNQKILTMDSMQATTAADVKAGASYLKSMEENLRVLKEALQ